MSKIKQQILFFYIALALIVAGLLPAAQVLNAQSIEQLVICSTSINGTDSNTPSKTNNFQSCSFCAHNAASIAFLAPDIVTTSPVLNVVCLVCSYDVQYVSLVYLDKATLTRAPPVNA